MEPDDVRDSAEKSLDEAREAAVMSPDGSAREVGEDTLIAPDASMDDASSTEESVERKEPVVQPAVPTIDLPRKKWHDRKRLLATVVLVAGILLGVGIAAPDRQAAKDEAKVILAGAKSDASDLKRDTREDAEQEREELLSDAKNEKADLLDSIESEKAELADVRTDIRTTKAQLRSIEKTRAAKQKQVDKLNRAIRSSTSLSRQNAVAKAQEYLDYSSFSCQGLIDQLSSEYADQFSVSDATYAAKQVGLC